MHARLLRAPSRAAAASTSSSSSSIPSAGCRPSWKARPPSRSSASPPPLSLLRAGASMEPASTEGQSDPPVHGVADRVVGVLGGGQLGKMLCQAASQMGIKVAILDPLKNCPASSVCHEHVVGSFNDSDTVREFAKRCDVLTVEIEHVDAVTLEKLEKQGVVCEPKASTIMIIQDKYRQKNHFSKFGIPLPDFVEVDTLSSIEKAGEMFGYPLMVKSKRLAYDGRGNAVAHDKNELSSVVSSLGGFEHGLYVERWTTFAKELSVIVARSRDGCTVCYPVVETIHKDNICHVVEAPAEIPEKMKKLATSVAEKAIKSLEGAGVFAVELFLTNDNQVLLNEVAPRPHNSGHHTIEACYTSQYEQHLRAILGLPLGDPAMKAPAAIMYNILGEDEGDSGFVLAHQLIKRALNIPGASVHWYAKPEIRKQRKMGHITIVGPSLFSVKEHLNKLLQRDTDGQKKVRPRAAVIMGSDSDLPIMKDAAAVLEKFNIPFELTVVSAHRTAERMYAYASSAKERGLEVIIAGAGGAAHLPGMVASLTTLPVIGVPIWTKSLQGMDSLLSIVQRLCRSYTTSDDDDSKSKVDRFDETNNFHVEHFFIRGHPDKYLSLSSASRRFGLDSFYCSRRQAPPAGTVHPGKEGYCFIPAMYCSSRQASPDKVLFIPARKVTVHPGNVLFIPARLLFIPGKLPPTRCRKVFLLLLLQLEMLKMQACWQFGCLPQEILSCRTAG